MRKTVEVATVVRNANAFLSIPNSTTREGVDAKSQRYGIIAMVENVLFLTDNYRGFVYLSTELDQDDTGHSFLKENYDETRRRYL